MISCDILESGRQGFQRRNACLRRKGLISSGGESLGYGQATSIPCDSLSLSGSLLITGNSRRNVELMKNEKVEIESEGK